MITTKVNKSPESRNTRLVSIDLSDLAPYLEGDTLVMGVPYSEPLDLAQAESSLRDRGFNDMEVDAVITAFYHQVDIISLSKLLADRLKR